MRVDLICHLFSQAEAMPVHNANSSRAQPTRMRKMERHLKNLITLSDFTMCSLSSQQLRQLKANLKCFVILVSYSPLSTLDILGSQQWQFGPCHNRIRGVSEITDFHVVILTYVYTHKYKPFQVHVTGVNETLSVC